MLVLEMCECGRCAPSSLLALGRTDKFQGRVTETLLTAFTIIETIHTNMRAFGIHSTIRHVVIGDASDILPNIRSLWSLGGSVSVDRLLRQKRKKVSPSNYETRKASDKKRNTFLIGRTRRKKDKGRS